MPTKEEAGARGAHAWQFVRAGGVDQVVFRTGEDIARLGELDRKLWVALACPTQGLEFDTRTLELIDTNKDGRIRPPELIEACEWACRELRDPDVLLAAQDTLAVRDLPEGSVLAVEARRILALVGKHEDDALTLQDVTGRSELLAAMRFNGDGVVTVKTAEGDEALQALIRRIIDTHGSINDRNGEPGIARAQADAFLADAKALRDWQARAVADGAAMPLGERTLAAAQALDAVYHKVEDFFARCRVAAYDIQAVQALNPSPDAYEALAGQTLDAQALADLPLAAITPGRMLPLTGHVNPAWSDALARLREAAVQPLVGEAADSLSEAQWQQLKSQLAACREWLRSRPATRLGTPEPEALDAWLAALPALIQLIDEDKGVEEHNLRLVDLERLLRYKRDLLKLLHNFVSFKSFYRREGAIFQAGTLYLDGRSCDLTVRVEDAKKHAMLAGLAKTCLAYCDCTREGKKMGIVAAFTAGDVDFLFVGRNGVFYDREGRDWDASITKLIENPTSVAQAFFSPYKKFVRMLEEQVAKRAAASEATAQGSLSSMATTLTTADKAAAAAKPGVVPKPGARVDVGTVAAIGVALGSISAVLVGIFGKFVDLGAWIPIAVLGIVIAISGPSMLIAWLKLRQRSLGPILDASGWAINGRMKVNVRLGASLSQTAHVPASARRLTRDPYAERRGWTGLAATAAAVAAVAALAWRMGWLDERLPPGLQQTPATVSGAAHPATHRA
ncbi:hypothetical protein PGB34_07865 [Xenophilus arseniciresistens]|uniref:EF-hand domain-containing protein n=1 Tax=Xenophilus arseniciresistens TaxID=1283306 RepID=A0AAE3N816_9BURK|nr:hypothetical protein [Xenophilus arseniciresistens]MDA7416278.1 hypothetical protein [Xenophilus arseniciresistens]